jgi:Domain of unknown function (DUF4116)
MNSLNPLQAPHAAAAHAEPLPPAIHPDEVFAPLNIPLQLAQISDHNWEVIDTIIHSAFYPKVLHIAAYVTSILGRPELALDEAPYPTRIALAQRIAEIIGADDDESVHSFHSDATSFPIWDLSNDSDIYGSKAAINYLYHKDPERCLRSLSELIDLEVTWDQSFIAQVPALMLITRLKQFIEREDWSLEEFPDLLNTPEALHYLSHEGFRKLMRDNRNIEAVFWIIKDYYLDSWNNGGNNNLSDLMGPVLLDNKAVVLEMLKMEGHFIADVSERLKNDKDVVIQALSNEFHEEEIYFGHILVEIPEQFYDDEDVMRVAISQYGRSFNFFSERLKARHDMIQEALNHEYFEALESAQEPDFVLRLVIENAELASFIPRHLLQEVPFLRELLHRNPNVINQLAANERVNKEVLDAFLLEHPEHLKLVNDRDYMLEFLNQHPSLMGFCHTSLIVDKDFIFDAIKLNTSCFQYAHFSIRDDLDIARFLSIYKPELLHFCSTAVMFELIHDDPSLIAFAGDEKLGDLDFCVEAARINPKVISQFPASWPLDHGMLVELCKHNGLFLEKGSESDKDDEALVAIAVNQNGLALLHASPRLKNAKQLAILALKNTSSIFKFLSHELRHDEDLIRAYSERLILEQRELNL